MLSHHHKLNKAAETGSDPYDQFLEEKGRGGSSYEISAGAEVSFANQNNGADPLAYPGEVDEATRYKIDYYLLDHPGLEILAEGTYQTKYDGTFSLQHDLHVYGNLADINDKSKANNWLRYLLIPEFEDKIFDAGRHVLPVFGQYGLVSHYFTFTTNRKIIVRKDKYKNIVCDIVANKILGEGQFGAVHMIEGTIKYRYDQDEGYRCEEGKQKRVAKLYKDRSKPSEKMIRELNNEIYFTKYNKSCGVRSGFFGELNGYRRSMGFSSRFIPEMELYDLIKKNYQGAIALGQLDRIRLIIGILKAVRDQAHQYNIVHCDFKPENIRVQMKGNNWVVNILDYGLAKLDNACSDEFTGTPLYISVEVLDKICQNRASDIFSIGIIIALILHDDHQLELSQLRPRSIFDTRDNYDWNIPLNGLFSYGLVNEFSPQIRSDITKILEDMLNFDYELRPDIDVCIDQFENIYRKIHDDRYNQEQLAAVHAAREAGRKFISLISEDKFAHPTREVMDQLQKNMQKATAFLPSGAFPKSRSNLSVTH